MSAFLRQTTIFMLSLAMKKLIILLVMLGKIQSSLSQSISSDSLVLHIPFSGSAKDISGNHYDGIVKGAVLTTGNDNLPNSAYYFDGKSSIIIPDIKRLDRPLTAFTILIKLMVTSLDKDPSVNNPFFTNYNFIYWHRNSSDSGNAFLFSKLRSSWAPSLVDSQYNPYLSFNTSWCNIQETASGYHWDSSKAINKWHSIAYVYSGTGMKVYHNCSLMNTFTEVYPSISILCGIDPMQISLGNVPLDAFKLGYRYFKGKIDDLQIYTRALNEEEVKIYAGNLCDEKPVARLSVQRNACSPAVIDFTDLSDMKGENLYKRIWEINTTSIDTSRQIRQTFTSKGSYRVRLTNFTDSVTSYSVDTLIAVESIDHIKFLFPRDTSTSICKGSRISFKLNTDAIIKWNPCTFLSACDNSSVQINPQNDITYTVTGINSAGCRDTARVAIKIFENVYSVYIPNAFTPNGDGKNDTFGPLSINPIKSTNLNIYNRFGGIVFSSKERNYKWDGTFKGISQPVGVYVYTLTYTNGYGCETKQKRGTVKLIR